MTAALLGTLAVLLLGPVPALLAGQDRLRRTPWAALVLWQSCALAAVLAVLGSGLALATERRLAGPGGYVVTAAALGFTALSSARLLYAGHRVGTRLRLDRRRHRDRIDLLAKTAADVSVIEHAAPAAYCLPGMSGSRVVLSSGALRVLAPAELDAVLAHERAHLRARHDLVLEAFTVLHRAFPAPGGAARALGEVRLLVEVLADRAAHRRVGPAPVIAALGRLGGSETPRAGLAMASGPALGERCALLLDARPRPVQAAGVLLAAAALLALPTAFVVLPWLHGLR